MSSIEGPIQLPTPIENDDYFLYRDLYFGVRDAEDPVTVRTMLVDTAKMLGVENPEWEKLNQAQWDEARIVLQFLLEDTILAPLQPEFLTALGLEGEEELGKLDLLVVNGRHKAEPLWSKLTEYAQSIEGKENVAAFNPVGHYNDGQARVAGIANLKHQVEHLAIIASTQTEKGGSLEVLSQVIRLLRDPDFAARVKNLDIVIPMFGGSRGHRLGQRNSLVYEVMETVSSAKILGMPLANLMSKVWWKI